jgi:hypothetical protein
MNCEQVRKFWTDDIDQVADLSERGEAVAHLVSCAECRRYKAQMTDLLGGLEYLRSASERRPVRWRAWPAVAFRLKIAAAILIVCGTILLMVRPFTGKSIKATVPPANEARSFAKTLKMTTGEPEIPQPIVKLHQESAQRLLAVQYKTDNPKVHLFVLYPTARSISTGKKLN